MRPSPALASCRRKSRDHWHRCSSRHASGRCGGQIGPQLPLERERCPRTRRACFATRRTAVAPHFADEACRHSRCSPHSASSTALCLSSASPAPDGVAGLVNVRLSSGWLQAFASLMLCGTDRAVLHLYASESPAPPPFVCVLLPPPTACCTTSTSPPTSHPNPTPPFPPIAHLPGARSDGSYTILLRGTPVTCLQPPPTATAAASSTFLLISIPDASASSAWQVQSQRALVAPAPLITSRSHCITVHLSTRLHFAS